MNDLKALGEYLKREKQNKKRGLLFTSGAVGLALCVALWCVGKSTFQTQADDADALKNHPEIMKEVQQRIERENALNEIKQAYRNSLPYRSKQFKGQHPTDTPIGMGSSPAIATNQSVQHR